MEMLATYNFNTLIFIKKIEIENSQKDDIFLVPRPAAHRRRSFAQKRKTEW